jgi:hypothetical protein
MLRRSKFQPNPDLSVSTLVTARSVSVIDIDPDTAFIQSGIFCEADIFMP